VSGRIDVHGHLGAYGPFHVPAGDVDALVRRMDALGVERLLLSHHAAFSSDYHWGNAAAAAERQAGRIFFYAVANPNYPEETEAELDRLSSRPGFVGVKFHPDTHQQALEGQGYASALAWAARRGCPVLVHFWLGSRHNDVGNVRAVAARHPGVRFIPRISADQRKIPSSWPAWPTSIGTCGLTPAGPGIRGTVSACWSIGAWASDFCMGATCPSSIRPVNSARCASRTFPPRPGPPYWAGMPGGSLAGRPDPFQKKEGKAVLETPTE